MARAGVEYDPSQRPGDFIKPALSDLRKQWGKSVSREQLCLHGFYPPNLALGLHDGTLIALKQGKQLQPFSELMKYLIQGKNFSKVKSRFGNVDLSFSV
jgi:oxaloacetate decarboxylase (Na+ extruding) subunit alpha